MAQKLKRARYSIHDTAYRYVNNRLINPLTGGLIPYKESTPVRKPNSKPLVYTIEKGHLTLKVDE